jgi:uncharacterized protein (DUF736 family)
MNYNQAGKNPAAPKKQAAPAAPATQSREPQSRQPSSRESVGALWKKTSRRGLDYFSGIINGVAIVIFPVTDKRGPQSPDYKIFRSEDRPAAEDDSLF